ncbi:cupin [Compostimonas suwonensis]|uniref:Cupin domain-containing protein n=1 Tax=Compostimonas suwonensis TaxID=1048394 RepID=A0A2M9C0D3_9MICO|nr:cupin [Compostimonas suwonensis]PJJ63797.1 hypothetical protein CLV54_1473 [Compostimonas suwonensis]
MPLTPSPQLESVLVRAATVEVVGSAPSSTALLADFEQTGGHLSANRTALGPGQDGPPPHYHSTSAELFFMISGALRVLAGDRVEVLIVFTPGIERFEYFRMVERIQNGQASPRDILITSERFDNHFTTSPLWPSKLVN